MRRYQWVWILLLLLPASLVGAQETALVSQPVEIPSSYTLSNIRFEYQGWNNCGPATLTNALTHFGYTDNQQRAARWLKPNGEDKNVSPQEMVAYVNSQVPELPVYALTRMGGDLELLRLLLSQGFPVIIEQGYDPPPHDLGWMGHYLLLGGYDDAAQQFMTYDSYEGPNKAYSYDHIDEYWRHFNRTYIVLYESGREPELLDLLGDDADIQQNALKTLEELRGEATRRPEDAFTWFNLGTTYVALAPVYQQQAYEFAAVAFDEARKFGLPFRMMWYQFGPLEAYNAVGRYQDTLALTSSNLNDGGGHFVEETFYYAGVAREQMGDTARALDNYRQAVFLNGNYEAARAALNRLQGA
jgi:tetratricopeptide (TPR) repeat protein